MFASATIRLVSLMKTDYREYRVLICTHSPEDGDRISAMLFGDNLNVDRCDSVAELTEETAASVGVVVFGPGALGDSTPQAVISAFASGKPDRDPPIILLWDAAEEDHSSQFEALLSQRSHVTPLEWPVPKSVLVQAVRSAIHTRRLQCQLRELDDQFRILMDRAPVAFGIVQGTRFILANRFFAEWSGYTVEELLSTDFPALVHPAFRNMMEDRARRRQAGEAVPDHYEFLALTKSGEERWFDFSPAIIEYRGKPAIIGAGLDITSRKRAEQALQRSESRLRLLSQTATKLLLANRPEEILGEVFNEAADHLGADIFVNYLVVPDGSRLRIHAWRGLDDATAKALEFIEFDQPFCGQAARERRRIVLNRQELLTLDASTLRSLGVRTYACHPLQDQAVLGTISFCSRSRDEFTDEELDVMRTVADQASMALARQSLTEALQQRATALDEANQAKDRFLAVLSHELRTPLTPVLAAVSMIQRNQSLEPTLQRNLEMIRRNIEFEARLIDDLLDLNRIERGKVELEKRRVNVCTILHQAVEVCRPEMEARDLHFATHFCGSPEPIEADPGRLQQVFWNLIKNAIKFTPPGGCVGISCRAEKESVVVEVTDSGVGIDPGVLPGIFDAFAQADRSITREFGGLGLGLSISKSLVQLHGGTLEAHSPGRNKGSTFVVRLPCARTADAGTGSPADQRGTTSPPQNLRILLVEDHQDTAEMIALILEGEGHEVQTVPDVATALKAAAEHQFDLLVSDLGLPDASGLDLMRELRARGVMLPAIALSGYGQEHDVRKSHEAGFSAHLVKPADIERLLHTVGDVAAVPCS